MPTVWTEHCQTERIRAPGKLAFLHRTHPPRSLHRLSQGRLVLSRGGRENARGAGRGSYMKTPPKTFKKHLASRKASRCISTRGRSTGCREGLSVAMAPPQSAPRVSHELLKTATSPQRLQSGPAPQNPAAGNGLSLKTPTWQLCGEHWGSEKQ